MACGRLLLKALQLIESIPRYLLTKAVGTLHPPVFWSPMAMLRYLDIPEPYLPGPKWIKINTRYGGICGSDMHTLLLKNSPALSPFVSFPFTLGHENVGVVVEVGGEVEEFNPGDRVVVEPVLPCVTRGIEEPCEFCIRGETGLCLNFTEGDLSPGLLLGACRDTGGSWSSCFVAHKSQVFSVPDQVSDDNAVMVEPFCCALHAVLRDFPKDHENVLVMGAGTIGLCTVAALRALDSKARVIVVAKHAFQAQMAIQCGADDAILQQEEDHYQTLSSATGGRLLSPILGKRVMVGGADIVYECVGSSNSTDDTLRLTRTGGKVVLVGLASLAKGVDWTPIWLNELTIRGSYCYGMDRINGQRLRTFQIALDWMTEGKLDLSSMVTHRFDLRNYKKALVGVTNKGKNKMIKAVFAF